MRTLSICLISICYFFSATVFSAQQWDEKLTVDELPNGFNYIIYPSKSSSEPFNLRLIVHAGSIDDTIPGIAHIVEHMVFRHNDIYGMSIHQFLNQIGWKSGLQINALTRQTETQFMVRTRPNDVLNLEQSIALLANLTLHPSIQPDEWNIEKKVILEELRLGEGVASRINDQKKAIIRHDSQYTNGATIGFAQTIKKTTANDIRAFHDTYYVPANMTLIVSGNITAEHVKAAIKKTFGQGEKTPVAKRDYVNFPLVNDLYIGKVQDPQGTSSFTTFGLRFPLLSRATDAGIEQRLQQNMLRKLMKAELSRAKELYKNETNIKSILVTSKEPTPERGIIAFQVRTSDHQRGLTIALTEWQRLMQNGVDEQELAKLKHSLLRKLDNNRIASAHRTYTQWEDKMTSAVMQNGVLTSYEDNEPLLRKIISEQTVESLNTRMRELLASQDQFLFYQVPGNRNAELPNKEQVRHQQRALSNTKLAKAPALTVVTKKAAPKQAKQLPTVPDLKQSELNIASKQAWSSAHVTRWTLKNGDTVTWLNQSAQGKIYLRLLSQSTAATLNQPDWLNQTAYQLWEQADYAFATQTGFKDWRRANNVDWQWAPHQQQLDLGLMVSAKEDTHLKQALQSYAVMQQTPEWHDLSISDLKKDLAAQLTDKTAQAQIEQFSQSQLEQTVSVFSRQPIYLYIVGKLSSQTIEENVLPYLAGIKRDSRVVNDAAKQDTHLKQPASTKTVKHIYHDNKATVTVKSQTPMTWSPEASFEISALNPIAQRALKNRLRHQLGGVYRMNFEMNLNKDNQVESTLSFTADPLRVDELLAEAKKVLNHLDKQIARENIELIKNDIAFAEQVRLQSPNTWLRRLQLSFERYQSPEYLTHMLTLDSNISAASLTQWANKIFPQPVSQTQIDLPLENTTN
ncbi:M16 family metallopeptidase [Vibrio tritonius]|uniref:M16 family metallopeptidase n=1 Tax=Vibrio tritonius TaxID=1435069 RepID=UPI00315D3513